ncbi:NifU family protein [Dyadobacter fanqingshengii]|uniref:NifU family protein n=1 Tax=Dyadobacter fanqingshengii TaxID=2906443 RepID=A0A9X1T8Y4_9BACT|nr:NifU family protein [Dyadobacter fanqingshengii]MCF0039379.1 NifU family protein [Dyadobacter fanqingshengii]MCF2503079.1 NifU family protein [Dyadobacter fanqingshengii]USJ33807.1 NifU family protein [Dyadobacter fanqingshengii]
MLTRPVFVYTELSPNPNSMKFVLNFELVPDGLSFDYPSLEAALEEGKASPLASDLFQFPHVKRVFIASNFVTITKDDVTAWEEVLRDTKQFIKIYFEENHPVFAQQTIDKNTLIVDSRDSDTVQKIKAALDQYVRPAVESDGGAINFHSFNEDSGVVKVLLQGSCSGCPSSTLTLKAGIENLLTRMVPDVKEVVAEGV